MNRNIEFYVNGIVTGESGRLRVIGRCLEDLIQREDVFTCGFKYVDCAEAPSGLAHVGVRPLELKVVRLEAYGRELERLGPGMTGSIDLVGTGFELVLPGSLLGMPQVVGQALCKTFVQDASTHVDTKTSA